MSAPLLTNVPLCTSLSASSVMERLAETLPALLTELAWSARSCAAERLAVLALSSAPVTVAVTLLPDILAVLLKLDAVMVNAASVSMSPALVKAPVVI